MTTKMLVLPLVVCAIANADETPAPVAGQAVKRFTVPPLAVPDDQRYNPMTNSAAISDDGARVIIDNHPMVDVWDTAAGRCVRLQANDDWWMVSCNVIIAQDASRFYIRNDKTKKMDAYAGNGARIGSRPQIGFGVSHGLKRTGYDFATRDYVMGSRLPAELGIFMFDPNTGSLRNVIRIKDIWDVERCVGFVQRPGGDFLAYYPPGAPNQRQGLNIIAKNGRFTKLAGIPSKDMKVVNHLALNPDGRYVMFQGMDRLQVWDYQTPRLVLDWRQEYRTPLIGRFTGDGRLAVLSLKTNLKDIATSGLTGGYENNTARLDVMDIPSLRIAGQLELSHYDALIPTFAFSPNGKHLVVADWQLVELVDVARTFPAK